MFTLEGKFNKNCKVFNDDVEDEAISTILNILNTKEHADTPVRIMPDVHAGKGIVIGFTQPLTDAVCPSHVGVDIGCTVDMFVLDKKVNPEEYPIINHRIKQKLSFGMDLAKSKKYEEKDMYKFLRSYYDKARASWSDMVNDVYIDDDYIYDVCTKIGMELKKFYWGIGSVGGGNHMIEIGENSEGFYTVLIHCGSRNFGKKVCEYWEKVANGEVYDKKKLKEMVREIKQNTEDKTLIPDLIEQAKKNLIDQNATPGYLTGGRMKGYITDMVLATGYALFNHKVIADIILEIFGKINGASVTDHITSIHNYIDFDDHIIRKGAIRAYKDERILVPLNMRDGVAVCRGLGNEDWNFSCSHGAGRRMSRAKAKETLSMEHYQEEMQGIFSTSVTQSTIDESPSAYKDSGTILELIKETCEIVEVVKPVINIKDTSEGPSWSKKNRNSRNSEREANKHK